MPTTAHKSRSRQRAFALNCLFDLDKAILFEPLSWTERLPRVNPVARSRKRKSAHSQADSTVRMASRAGSWTSRSISGMERGSVIRIPWTRAEEMAEKPVIIEAENKKRRANDIQQKPLRQMQKRHEGSVEDSEEDCRGSCNMQSAAQLNETVGRSRIKALGHSKQQHNPQIQNTPVCIQAAEKTSSNKTTRNPKQRPERPDAPSRGAGFISRMLSGLD